MKNAPGVSTEFTISHKQVAGKHLLTIAPSKEAEGWPPKEVEVSQEQWDELRFHFGTAHNDKTGEAILSIFI